MGCKALWLGLDAQFCKHWSVGLAWNTQRVDRRIAVECSLARSRERALGAKNNRLGMDARRFTPTGTLVGCELCGFLRDDSMADLQRLQNRSMITRDESSRSARPSKGV